MAKINLVPDVIAPLTVTAVDLVTETVGTPAGQYNNWAAYIMAIGGYAGAMFGFGGDFVKNIGIASLPWAAKKIYNQVRATPVTSQRLAYRGVSRYPAPATQSPYEGVRIT